MGAWGKLATGFLLVGLTTPVACGGDEEKPAPTRARFVAQADFICKRLGERSAPIDRRLDRTSDIRRQLALLRRRHAYQEHTLTTLQGLEFPDAGRQEIARYIGAVSKRRALGRRLESALEREDLPAARAVLLDGVAVNRSAYRAAVRLGLEECEKGKPASGRDVLDLLTPDVGVPIRLAAEETTLELTVEAVIDPLEVGATSLPDGTRLVGVQLTVENTGDSSISIALAQQATLTNSREDQLDPAFLGTAGQCEESLSVTTLSAGSKRSGCIPFQVPEGQLAKAFQFGGFGGDTAEWDLTSVRPVSGVPPETAAIE